MTQTAYQAMKNHVTTKKSVMVSYRVHHITNMQVAGGFTIGKHNICNLTNRNQCKIDE